MKIRLLLIIALLFIIGLFESISQERFAYYQISTTEADSLNSLIEDAPDKQKAYLYYLLAHYYLIDVDSFFKAYDFMSSSVKYAASAEENDQLVASYLLGGLIFQNSGNYAMALDYFYKAEELNKEVESKYFDFKTNLGLANVYMFLNDVDRSKFHTDIVLKNAVATNDSVWVFKAYGIRGNLYGLMKNFDSAIVSYENALAVYNDDVEFENYLSVCNNIALALMENNKSQEAQLLYDSLEIIMDTSCYSETKARIYHNIGRLYYRSDKTDLALRYLKVSESLSKASENLPVLSSVYLGLSNIYDATGDQDSAYKYYKLHIEAKEKVFGIQQQRRIQQLQIERAEQLAENEISKQKIRLKYNKIILVGSIIILISLISLIYMKFRNAKFKLLALDAERNKILSELDSKQRELVNMVMNLNQNRQTLAEMDSFFNKILGHNKNSKIAKLISDQRRSIRSRTQLEQNWDEFRSYFEELHPDFLGALKQKYPELSSNELTYCAFIKLNLSNKHISVLLNINESSVKTSKYRIKKKLLLTSDDDLMTFIHSV